jgi:ATP-dependent protease HslVU (ClpYQ) peptidase subunit
MSAFRIDPKGHDGGMTLIAAVRHSTGAVIGADSMMTDVNRLLMRSNDVPKIITISEHIVMGTAGSARFNSVLRSFELALWEHFEDMAPSRVIQEFTTRIVRRISDAIPDRTERGSALLVIGHDFYVLDSELGISHLAGEYATLGSGEDFAAGALHGPLSRTLINDVHTDERVHACKGLVTIALEAALAHCYTIRPPWVFAETRVKSQPAQ